MPKIDVIDASKKVVDSIDLSDAVFAAKVNEPVVHQVVVAQLAAKRRGTQSAKTRDEVRGGGIKPWKQKGSGQARAGSSRSPLWRGGGVVFAPKPRDYAHQTPKKMRRLAFTSVLTNLLAEGRLLILDSLEQDEIKTKNVVAMLDGLGVKQPVLVLHDGGCDNFVRSSRNVPYIKTLPVTGLNVYDLLRYETVLCTRKAVDAIEKRFAK